jgi:integral membrane protein
MAVLASLVARSYKPKADTIPLIYSALKFYRVGAYITGTFLLLLVVEMITKYGFHEVYQLGGSSGFIGLVPEESGPNAHDFVTGVNLSIGILIVHGWFYVVYLIACFQVWSRMRWPFARFVLMALGGVVPFLSFIAEHFVAKLVRAELAELLEGNAAKAAALQASSPTIPASPHSTEAAH